MTIFSGTPLLGILRGILDDEVEFISEIAAKQRLTALEITMNTKDAPRLIRMMTLAANGRFKVGAGTVLSLDDLHSALDAGASFVVLPSLVTDVVSYCGKNGIPVFPGALTPTEILNAWNAGATMVKVFPSNVFGPSYIREIRGPFDKIALLACGGVNESNIQSYFSFGAAAAAFGGSIFKREWIESRDEKSISAALRSLLDAYGKTR